MLRTLHRLALWVALAALAPLASADEFTGRVVGITDGDTIEVMRDGRAVKIRLFGIDCPESGQDFGSRAKQFTSESVFNKDVRVVVQDTDRYGRLVADIYTQDGKRLNESIVSNGLAWWYVQYAPRDTGLQRREERAKLSRLGLWSDPNPIPPWDFRRGDSSTRPQKDSSAPPVSTGTRDAAPNQAAQANEVSAEGLYITKTGTKYHRDGCRYLSKSKIPTTLANATAQGYTPCSVCNPPVSNFAPQPVNQQSPVARGRAPPPAAVQSESFQAPAAQSAGTVYVTNTGEKYHRAGCRYLSKSSIPMSLDDAQASGYTPCSVCRP